MPVLLLLPYVDKHLNIRSKAVLTTILYYNLYHNIKKLQYYLRFVRYSVLPNTLVSVWLKRYDR